jgi:hypothetical protein
MTSDLHKTLDLIHGWRPLQAQLDLQLFYGNYLTIFPIFYVYLYLSRIHMQLNSVLASTPSVFNRP